MALLSPSGLETHPAGTANPAGIVNDNWTKLNEVVDPGLSNASPRFGVLAKGLQQGAASVVLTPAASVAINFLNPWQELTPGQAVTLTFTNLGPGREVRLWLKGDGSNRALTWPAAIMHSLVGSSGTLTASKNALVILRSFGTTVGAVHVDFREV